MITGETKSKKIMKGGEQNLNTEPITTLRYYEICPVCTKKIISKSESQLRYNLKLHLEKHVKENSVVKQ